MLGLQAGWCLSCNTSTLHPKHSCPGFFFFFLPWYGSHRLLCLFGSQMVAQFWKIEEPLGGESLLKEVFTGDRS